jgi:thioester reductase-like protein
MIAMNDYFIKHGVTHTEISTQVAKLFINQINDTTLKVLTTGGEKLGDDVIDVDYRFVDSYGPTEACVDVTSIDLEDKIDYSSIGFLLDNTKAYVLDEEFRRVPIGAVGELFLAGKQVADGYLNRDDETRKAFLENPFDAGEEYSVMYRSGDMVRVLPDGTLGIVNRRDKQVKIRGNRVELSEVESVIRNIDEIEDVTVQTIKNGANNELVAYVVAANDLEGITLKNHVCDYVAEHKPQYMVPSFVVELDAIPLTVNGKVDTRALPEVDVNKLREEYVAPENDTESFFAECFEEILGIDKVGATDNFFALGGDSLQVIKIIVESINNGYSISYADVFDNPTPRLLSNVVSSEKHEVSLIKDNYDYALIDDLLKRNNLDSFANGECVESLGNVLLTGATGFLGIHLLYELLENEDGDVYCLIRPKDNQTGKDRLKSAWDYYFKRDFSEFENRLHVVEGSITDYDDFVKLESCEIDTVINSAGNVKHFAKGTELKDINFGGTVNALEFAKTKDARFIQVSTDSVSGARVNNVPPKEIKLYETDLFIDQTIDNKYVESKFLAERAVLQAAADNELDVKIMRVGNLMARSYDGLFQRNYESNAFVNQLKSFVALGKMPSSFVEYDVQLCAIDITAKSIIALSKTPKDCCVFHPFSNNNSTYREVVNVFNKLGLNIELSDEESFQNSLDNVLDDKSKQKGVFGLLTHLNNSDIKYEYISVDNDYTIKVLSELGVTWPEITEKYLSDFIKLLDNLDFFKVI